MSNYTVNFKKSAVKELYKLPNREVFRIIKLIDKLSTEPRPRGCKKLKGYRDLWRVRSGNYRIIYSIEDHILIIEVLEIAHRKDTY